MLFSEYPSFTPITKATKSVLEKALFACQPELSEYTFAGLYAWRESEALDLAGLKGFIILRSRKDGDISYFDPLGPGDPGALMTMLCAAGGYFKNIPEKTRALAANDKTFKIELDQDNMDYLYHRHDLIALAGKKYDGKRNLIKKFKSSCTYEYVTLTDRTIGECLAFEEGWCAIKDCDSQEGLRNERRALAAMVGDFQWLGLHAGAIKIKGKICGMGIGERLNNDTFVVHILKADPTIPGLYQTMMNEFLSHEAGDFRYVNLEQDLGIPALRQAKESYHPVRKIAKYTLRKVS
ncbi:MAG: phosphatidylglycerol lysyltransferase domain-containing protein [Candidatus Omnitrophica bacterium]|nr:phosphatidylglycerol lysyltransferase domain-containing protein [Candidatus Omnitrophota bacterium]